MVCRGAVRISYADAHPCQHAHLSIESTQPIYIERDFCLLLITEHVQNNKGRCETSICDSEPKTGLSIKPVTNTVHSPIVLVSLKPNPCPTFNLNLD